MADSNQVWPSWTYKDAGGLLRVIETILQMCSFKVNGNTKIKQKVDGPLPLSFLFLNSLQFFLPNTEYNLLHTQKYFL